MPNAAPPTPAQARAEARWSNACSPPKNRHPSNSRFEDSNCPVDPEVGTNIGLDTISWCWSDSDAVDALLRLDGIVPDKADPRPLRIVPAPGGSVRVNRRLDGLGQVGAFPGASMLYVEGRARALHRRDEDDHGLGAPRHLPMTDERVRDDLGRLLGRSLSAPSALRRADLAGELRFDRGEDGQELLRLLDGLHSPNHKTAPVRERGGSAYETVYWRTPKRSVPVLRAYDKGIESRTASPGERIRLERQVRYDSKKRMSVDQFLSRDLAALYAAPIRTWLQTGGVVAGTAEQLLRLLTDAAVIWPSYWCAGSSWCSSAGRAYEAMWTARKVERIIGTLAVVAAYGSSWPAWSPKQRQRRMFEVRQLGLLVLDSPPRLDVDREVQRLCEAWSTAALRAA